MSSPQIIAVCGATGRQGGAVVENLLWDETYSVRAITRNPQSEAALALAAQGVEVVQADYDQPETLQKAFEGCYGVFAVTNYYEAGDGEVEQGQRLIDAAKFCGVRHFIWSSAPDQPGADGWHTKAKVGKYLQASGLPYTQVYPCCYYDYLTMILAKQPTGDYLMDWKIGNDTPLPCMDPSDFGTWVAAAFTNPEEWINKDLKACSEWLTPREIANTLSNAAGVEVILPEFSVEDFYAVQHDPNFPMNTWPHFKYYLDNYNPESWDPELGARLSPNGSSWEAFAASKFRLEPTSPVIAVSMQVEVIKQCGEGKTIEHSFVGQDGQVEDPDRED